MSSNITKLIAATLLTAWIWPAVACDGTPPKLINKDNRSYAYTLICGKKTEQGNIDAGSSKELEGKSGCSIKLDKNRTTKLHTEMVCTIKGTELTCDLL